MYEWVKRKERFTLIWCVAIKSPEPIKTHGIKVSDWKPTVERNNNKKKQHIDWKLEKRKYSLVVHVDHGSHGDQFHPDDIKVLSIIKQYSNKVLLCNNYLWEAKLLALWLPVIFTVKEITCPVQKNAKLPIWKELHTLTHSWKYLGSTLQLSKVCCFMEPMPRMLKGKEVKR